MKKILSIQQQESPFLTIESQLEGYKQLAELYQNLASTFQPTKQSGVSLELNPTRQYFKIKGLSSEQKQDLFALLYLLKQTNPAIDYEDSSRLLKKERVHLNASALHCLKNHIQALSTPSALEQRLLALLRPLPQDILTVESQLCQCNLARQGDIKYDKKSKTFTYKLSDREGRYFITQENLITLLTENTDIHPTIKGKASIGKQLLWKWGCFIPQALAGGALEFAHTLQTHGNKLSGDGFFVDGADDMDMLLATNRDSVQVVKGISTFLVMPMAIDLLNDGLNNQGEEVEDAKQQKQTLHSLKKFLAYQQQEAPQTEDALRDLVTHILSSLDDTELYARHAEKKPETMSLSELKQFLDDLSVQLSDKLESLKEETKEIKWKYRAIWCMATGLKLHFICNSFTTIASLSKSMAAPQTTTHGIRDFAALNHLGQVLLIGDLIANPIAFLGQIISAYCAYKEASHIGEEMKDTREILKKIEKEKGNTSLETVQDSLEDCMHFFKQEHQSMRTLRGLTIGLCIGQALMALGTLLSIGLTLGGTSPAAPAAVCALLHSLDILRTIASSTGLAGTLIGAGGGGFADYLHDKQFGSTLEPEDLYGIYAEYHKLRTQAITDRTTYSEMALFMEAKNLYISKNPQIYEQYIRFQGAHAELKSTPKAETKYVQSSKYHDLQAYMYKAPDPILVTMPEPILCHISIQHPTSDRVSTSISSASFDKNAFVSITQNPVTTPHLAQHTVTLYPKVQPTDNTLSSLPVQTQVSPLQTPWVEHKVLNDSQKEKSLSQSFEYVSASKVGPEVIQAQQIGSASSFHTVLFNTPLEDSKYVRLGYVPSHKDDEDPHQWNTLVEAIFDNPNYKATFNEKLSHRIVYSRLSNKARYFSTVPVYKHRKGPLSLFKNMLFGQKQKTLRSLNISEIQRDLVNNPKLLPIVQDACKSLIKDLKTKSKRRIRGVEYRIPQLFIKQCA